MPTLGQGFPTCTKFLYLFIFHSFLFLLGGLRAEASRVDFFFFFFIFIFLYNSNLFFYFF